MATVIQVANDYNAKATLGEHLLSITLKRKVGSGESQLVDKTIKKVNVPVDVQLPAWEDLFTKSTSVWDNDTYVTRITNVGGSNINEYKAYVSLDAYTAVVGKGAVADDIKVSYMGANIGGNDYNVMIEGSDNEVLDYANDKELVSILAIDNYLQDGPDFVKSNQYIEKVRSDFDLDMEHLLSFCSEEGLNSYVNSLNLSNSKKQLFIDVVMESGLLDNFKSYKDIFLESENHMNEVFNSVISTLAFLKNNQDKWKIEDGEIQFSTEDLVNKYNSLVDNLL